jgi:hypothetical protein
MVAALLLIILIAGIYAFGGIGRRHQQMVEQCKSLRIGTPQHEILAVLGEPTRRAKMTQGPLVLERMFFAPSTVLPDVSAAPISVDLDTVKRQAVRIICDEASHRRSPEIEALEKRGIH